MYVNEMNKIGDSYLPCIAMAHSPQVKSGQNILHSYIGTHWTPKYNALTTDISNNTIIQWMKGISQLTIYTNAKIFLHHMHHIIEIKH